MGNILEGESERYIENCSMAERGIFQEQLKEKNDGLEVVEDVAKCLQQMMRRMDAFKLT